jgi:hypothetical protein
MNQLNALSNRVEYYGRSGVILQVNEKAAAAEGALPINGNSRQNLGNFECWGVGSVERRGVAAAEGPRGNWPYAWIIGAQRPDSTGKSGRGNLNLRTKGRTLDTVPESFLTLCQSLS